MTDWGDVSELRVTITAASPLYSQRREYLGGGVERFYWRSSWSSLPVALRDSTTVIVPRRSGPIPSDDVIEVNVADLADNGTTSTYDATPSYYVNGQYVGSGSFDLRYANILRSDLLANDACPVGVDCSDPYQWPVEIVGDDTRLCRPEGTGMEQTSLGILGCDDLSEYRAIPDPTDPSICVVLAPPVAHRPRHRHILLLNLRRGCHRHYPVHRPGTRSD